MTPDNGGYMVAGYIAAAVVYGGYALVLWRRRRALAARWRTVPPAPAAPRVITPPPRDVA